MEKYGKRKNQTTICFSSELEWMITVVGKG
jgi:hypothetical protein